MSAPISEGPSSYALAVGQEPLVLVVNDVESARYLMSRIVRSAGWRVAEAGNGLEALQLTRELMPDLVVLDVKLPDILGYEVCRQLKADPVTAGIPVVQTSATFVTGEGKARGLDAGADAYLTQPLEAIELIAMIRSLLRLRRTEGELRERARALVAADLRKDEFLAMLAHELRNPLSAILVATNLLEDEKTDPADMRKFGRTIGRQARHLGRLVDDLLDISRITSGKIQLAKRPLDLVAVVGAMLQSSYPTVDRGRHDLVTKLPDREIWVDGDATRLEQVLGNLLGNALKYTQEGGQVVVSVDTRLDPSGPRAVFTIADRGRGIAPENIASVWDLFFQVDNSLARPQSGLGIGLTMVRRLIEMHGGSVSVESEGIDRGTTFSFELPQIKAPKERDEAPRSTSTPQRLKVLLVDDNEDACELFAYAIQQQGHEVEFVNRGEDGLERVKKGDFDVAIYDIGLPDLDGYELARRTGKALEGRAPYLIALTGYGRPQDRAAALDAGFDVHLVKPLDVAAVTSLFADVLTKKVARGRAAT